MAGFLEQDQWVASHRGSGLSGQEPTGDAPRSVRPDDVALSIDTLGRGG